MDSRGCKVTFKAVNMFPYWSADHYQSIRAKGFNAVRLLLPWREYEPARGQFAKLDQIDAAVNNARAAGLYVILNMPQNDGWNRPPAWASRSRPLGCVNQPAADGIDYLNTDGKAFFQTLARRYKDNHVVAAYDLVGEPHGTNDQSCILRFYSTVIDWVREVAPEKINVIEPGWGAGNPTSADVSHLRHRRNVAWSWHDYFAGDGNPATVFHGYNQWDMNGGNQAWDGVSGYPNPGDQADFEAQVQLHLNFARRAGIALMGVGEFGINSSAANAGAWMDQKTAVYNRYGITRVWWIYTCGENFGLKDQSCNWRYTADRILRG